MDLKKRFLLANAITVIIPVIITILITLAALFIDSKITTANFSLENYQKLLELKYDLAEGLDGVLPNPQIIEDKGFQTALQGKLAAIRGEVIILKDEQVIFSSRHFSKIDIAKCLDSAQRPSGKELLTFGDLSYTPELITLSFADGAKGQIILLAPIDWSQRDVARFLMIMAVTFLLSFLLTNFIVSRQYSKMIVTPLHNLQQAAAEISKGNLDYQIAEEGDREILALCRDLELMRLKLKESIYTQLKYEDNRKMLVSSISHYLKTPVTTIKGYVEGIMDGVAQTPEKITKYLQTIYLKAGQIDRMIDDLLLYAKLDLNQLPFDFAQTDIAAYVEEFLKQCEADLEYNQVNLTFVNTLPKPCFVQIDQDRMRRVLTNILDNCLKYMNKDYREIKVLLRETRPSITLEIRDNGSGMRKEDIPYIFDRFFRADVSRGTTKGSGLGLAIAKQIVEGHQGRIWAIAHEAEGTSIIISLPKYGGGIT
jgi:signal transduction histidine kinase